MSFLKSGQPIHTTGKNLAGLWRPSFVKTEKKLHVFGGGGNVAHDLHVLHFDDMRWETIQAAEGVSPSKRYGHTATQWNNSFIVFGGCNEFQDYCNDIHIFNMDTLTWTQPTITGSVCARYLHTSVVYEDKLFVYGGFAKSADCTYVLEEMNILDLKTMTWSIQYDIQPRYNHTATLVNHKMYIYGGKDEHGNTVSDLFVIHLQQQQQQYTCHLVLDGAQNSQMALLKSQHFCDAVCGKLFVFGRFLIKSNPISNNNSSGNNKNNGNNEVGYSGYSLWMLDLDTLEWQQQECDAHFQVGGWNYFTIIKETHPTLIHTSIGAQPTERTNHLASSVSTHHLLFLGNTDPYRPQGYDHFRDALVINVESLGLYDITPNLPPHHQQQQQHQQAHGLTEFAPLLNNPELSDFLIVPSDGPAIHAHQIILMSRWPHFRNMYKSGMIESSARRIEIPEPHKVVMAFLTYLYTDQLDDAEPWEVVCELLVMANMYLQHRLVKLCCQRLYQRHLTVSNCGVIFEKAMLVDETGLKVLALDYMFRHYGSVIKSNVLMHVSPSVQHVILEAVPVEAVLDVNGGRAKTFTATTLSHSFNHNSPSSITHHHHPSTRPMDVDDSLSSSHDAPLRQQQHYMTSSSSSATLSPSMSQHPQIQSSSSPSVAGQHPQRISGVTGLQRAAMANGLHTNSVEV